MKKFSDILKSSLMWVFIAIAGLLVLLAFLSDVFDCLSSIYHFIMDVGDGSFIIGLIISLFAAVGIFFVIRGFFSNLEKDMSNGSTLAIALYIALYFFGIIAFVYVIYNFSSFF